MAQEALPLVAQEALPLVAREALSLALQPSASAPGLIPRLWDQNAVDLELDLQQVGHTLPHALEAVAATVAPAMLRMHEHEPEDLLTASALLLERPPQPSEPQPQGPQPEWPQSEWPQSEAPQSEVQEAEKERG